MVWLNKDGGAQGLMVVDWVYLIFSFSNLGASCMLFYCCALVLDFICGAVDCESS